MTHIVMLCTCSVHQNIAVKVKLRRAKTMEGYVKYILPLYLSTLAAGKVPEYNNNCLNFIFNYF